MSDFYKDDPYQDTTTTTTAAEDGKSLSKRQQQKLVENKKRAPPGTNQTAFRTAERYYRSKVPPPSYDQVLDARGSGKEEELIEFKPLGGEEEEVGKPEGERKRAFYVKSVPGLIWLSQWLSPVKQREWIREILTQYAKPPNHTNLDAHLPETPPEGVWKHPSLLYKLRWTTLGYQYDWSSKTYPSHQRQPIPQKLTQLTRAIVQAIDSPFLESKEYHPEAGVVNFYQLKDSLTAHVDKSEENQSAPLISFSFGHDCVFLIGGEDKEAPPLALRLCSGDVLIMLGPSRGAYHGVPRIIEGTLPEHLLSDDASSALSATNGEGGEDWEEFATYLSTTRINMNVRQVHHHPNQLPSTPSSSAREKEGK